MASACSNDDDGGGGGAVATQATTEGGDPVAAAEQRVTDAEDGVTQSQDALIEAHGAFCSATTGYIETLNRYGRVFTDSAATVGDITTSAPTSQRRVTRSCPRPIPSTPRRRTWRRHSRNWSTPRPALAASIATASSVPKSTATPTTSTTTTLVPPATIERVQQAEDDLGPLSAGITDETPLVEAAADFNSAALALEVAWLRLLNDAQCLTDEQQANAVEMITAYTSGAPRLT